MLAPMECRGHAFLLQQIKGGDITQQADARAVRDGLRDVGAKAEVAWPGEPAATDAKKGHPFRGDPF